MPIIFDGHNDSFTKHYPPRHLRVDSGLTLEEHSFLQLNTDCHIDLPRALKAGYRGGLFAIFIDPPFEGQPTYLDPNKRSRLPRRHPDMDPPLDHSLALKATLEVLSHIFQDAQASGGSLQIVRSYSELETVLLHSPALAVVLHLEGCEAIDNNLEALETLYQAGLRSVGITWSRPNIFGNGVPFAYNVDPDTGPGLTSAGLRLVKRCTELGIMLDAAHLNAQGFYDLASASERPVVVSHTCAFALCHSSRALTDKQLKIIAQTGGLAGVSLNVPDLVGPQGERSHYIPHAFELYRCSSKDLVKLTTNPPEREAAISELEAAASHIVYIGRKIGFEHVALGSDFDGCLIPDELDGVEDIHRLLEILQKAGLSKRELEQVCYKNWLRVLRASWAR